MLQEQEQELNKLIELCKAGDKKAQQDIFNLKKDELFAICKRYALSSSEAEDMFIEGFTKIFQYIDTLSYGSFEPWARRVMINTCINTYHKELRRKTTEITTEEYSENVEIESDVKFTHDDLQYCLEQLGDEQRIIFNLFAIDDYKSKEIAEMLNISDEKVRTTIHRSKVKLKKLLTELDKKRSR